MSLADFVDEYVQPQQSSFVVKQDLINSYTSWRQLQQPTMQLTDLYKAQQEVHDILPNTSFRDVLTVQNEDDGTHAIVDESWQGFSLTFPGGNRVCPRVVYPSDEERHSMTPVVHWSFHFRKGYSSQPLMHYLTHKVTEGIPSDTKTLAHLLRESVARLQLRSDSCGVETIFHEGVAYTVFHSSLDG